MGTQIHQTPSGVRHPEHDDDRRRWLDRIGRAVLLAGGVLAYWILLAAPWSDQDKAKAVLVALVIAECGALIGSSSEPNED